MSKRSLQLLLVSCFFASALWAVEDPFVGQWKLNASKSKLTDEMKIDSVGANKYAFDFGGGTAETIVADGTDQPGDFGTTLSVTVLGPESWKVALVRADLEHKNRVHLLARAFPCARQARFACGSLVQVEQVERRPLGINTSEIVGKRVAILGKLPGCRDDGAAVLLPDDGLSFINPSEEETKSVKFDGKDYSNHGPNVPQGSVSSGRRLNERTLQLIDKISGKTVATEQIEVSPNHKTLTMTLHTVGRSKPNILVFDRE